MASQTWFKKYNLSAVGCFFFHNKLLNSHFCLLYNPLLPLTQSYKSVGFSSNTKHKEYLQVMWFCLHVRHGMELIDICVWIRCWPNISHYFLKHHHERDQWIDSASVYSFGVWLAKKYITRDWYWHGGGLNLYQRRARRVFKEVRLNERWKILCLATNLTEPIT